MEQTLTLVAGDPERVALAVVTQSGEIQLALLDLRVGETVRRRQQPRRQDCVAVGIQFDQQPGAPFLDHEHVLIAAVQRDSLQTLVVGLGREVPRDSGVMGHLRQGAALQFPATGEINADHRIDLFVNSKQTSAVAADGDSLQVGRVQGERLAGQHPTVEIQAEDRPGVVADGVQRRAIGVEGEARRLIQLEAWGIDALPVNQLKAEGAHQR